MPTRPADAGMSSKTVVLLANEKQNVAGSGAAVQALAVKPLEICCFWPR